MPGWAKTLTGTLHRRGFVVAISGGVDSAVCAALAARAVGPSRVYGLLMPERESSASSTERGLQLARSSELPTRWSTSRLPSTPSAATGNATMRSDACSRITGPGWQSKIVIAGGISGGINFFKLVVAAPDGTTREARLPLKEYLQIVAATNFKQRVRKMMEYFHADRLNYAVVGTPNRLEYDQGFFVKVGDGAADVKPIAHLYKTQVYAAGARTGVAGGDLQGAPTTDTYSLSQGQDEFYFALPYAQMDLALWASTMRRSVGTLADALGIRRSAGRLVYADIEAKRRAAAYLHGSSEILDCAG